MKVCRKCGSTDLPPGRLKKRDYICSRCNVEQLRAWQRDHPEKSAAQIARKTQRHRGTMKRCAWHFKHTHGISVEESEHWATILLDPGTRCAICGLPNYLIKTYRERGWPFFLGKRFGAGSHPRLTLDHVVPGNNEGGFRPLCHACNSLRGAAQFTDEEVLTEVRSKWQWFTAPRFLWWLNTTPGVGGRLHRSARCQKRDAEYADGASPQPEPPTTPPSTS